VSLQAGPCVVDVADETVGEESRIESESPGSGLEENGLLIKASIMVRLESIILSDLTALTTTRKPLGPRLRGVHFWKQSWQRIEASCCEGEAAGANRKGDLQPQVNGSLG
jgi:hypothetical protein